MSKTLSNDRPIIVMEMKEKWLARSGSSVEQLAEMMSYYHYRPYRLQIIGKGPWARCREIMMNGTDGVVDEDILWKPKEVADEDG